MKKYLLPIIIIIILLFVWYFLLRKPELEKGILISPEAEKETNQIIQSLQNVSESDEAKVIEQELNATTLDDLDKELNEIEKILGF